MESDLELLRDTYILKKQRLKITQLEKVMHFIKVNEVKLTRVILAFSFMFVAANASELFRMAYLANNERFLCHINLSF